MKPSILIVLLVIASVAHAQDFKRGSDLSFEYPAARTVSRGRTRSYSYPAHSRQMLAALATARRMSLYPAFSFAVAVEGETTIDGVSYRLYFPRVPPREAPYVFAAAPIASPVNRVYFEIPRERYNEFASLFRDFLNEHQFDTRQ